MLKRDAMSAYLIVNYDVEDADKYSEYQGGAVPALRIGTECEVLVLEHATEQLEGQGAGSNTVVLKFDSMDKAREIYESDAYQAVLPTRLGATSKHFAVLCDGFQMP